MTDDIIIIDPLEPGAESVATVKFLAVLIYPHSIRKRDEFVAAAYAYGIRVNRRRHHPEPSWAADALREVKVRPMQNRLQVAQWILHRRLEAGRALQWVLLTDGRASLTAAAKRSGGNRSHFMHTVWSQSLPVLHLSWAMLTSVAWPRIRRPDGTVWTDPRPPMLSLIARADWAIEAAAQSESKREFLLALADRPEYATVLRRFAETPTARLVIDCADSPTG